MLFIEYDIIPTKCQFNEPDKQILVQ